MNMHMSQEPSSFISIFFSIQVYIILLLHKQTWILLSNLGLLAFFLFSIYYTRSNPAFTFTFLFLLITSSEQGKMFGYSSHTWKKAYDTPDTPLYYSVGTEQYIQYIPGAEGSLPLGKIFLEACQILQIYVTQTFFSRDTKVSNKMGLPSRCLKGELLVAPYNLLH